MAPFGVYLHVPFCAAKCDYCAFATWTDRHHLQQAYLDACRIDLLSGVLRLSELAAYADDPAQAPAMLRFVADWHDTAMARGDRIG